MYAPFPSLGASAIRPTLIASFLAIRRRFFVGGAQELDDDTYARIPSEHSGRVLNKIGFQTVSAGDVHLSLNVSKVSTETGASPKSLFQGQSLALFGLARLAHGSLILQLFLAYPKPDR